MKRSNKHSFGTVLGVALTAVMGLALAPATRGADEPEPAGDFVRGAKAWAANCARCHNMRDPKEFNDDQWKVTVTHMRVRAGLTGQEARDILTFLQGAN